MSAESARQTRTRQIIPRGAFISSALHNPLIAGPNNPPFETITLEEGRQLSKRRDERKRGKEVIKGKTDEDSLAA